MSAYISKTETANGTKLGDNMSNYSTQHIQAQNWR